MAPNAASLPEIMVGGDVCSPMCDDIYVGHAYMKPMMPLPTSNECSLTKNEY